MKQTAVEWLLQQMKKYNITVSVHNASHQNVMDFYKAVVQVKEMFEQQIIDAYNQGSEAGYELAKNDDIYEGYKTKEAEQYYNETFKSE